MQLELKIPGQLCAYHEPLLFTLPAYVEGVRWAVAFDTARPDLKAGGQVAPGGQSITLAARSVMLLRHER